MPFIKDVQNKKFQKKRMRAWNVLDIVVNDQVNDQVNVIGLCYNSLKGEQLEILKKILFFSNNIGKTRALQINDFSQFAVSTFKTNVARLIKKGLIKRGNIQKKGRGGFFSFEISDELQRFLKTTKSD